MTEPAIFEIERGKPLPEIPSGASAAIFVDDGMGDGPAAYDAEALLDRVDSVVLVADGFPLGPARIMEGKAGKMAGSPLQAHAIMIEQGRALLVTTPPEMAALWSDVIERKGKTSASLQFLRRHVGRLN